LKFLQLDNVKPILEFSGLQYVFSPVTKTIIFKETKYNKKSLIKTLEQIKSLDTEKDQVTIKITIFDISQNKLKKVGINPNLSFDFGLLNPTGALLTRASIPAFKSSLAFLQSNGVSNVFQSTSYLIADGEKLDFKKVVSMPFLDENYAVTAVTGSVNQSKKYKYKDIGFKVSTTPTIVYDTVYLDFTLEVGNVVSSGDLPVTAVTNIMNKFSLKKGDVILLAGIQKDTITESKSGLPSFLNFFGLSSTTTDNNTFNISIEIL
jgi:type II secretory pathway component GspD/PulD (secretin)